MSFPLYNIPSKKQAMKTVYKAYQEVLWGKGTWRKPVWSWEQNWVQKGSTRHQPRLGHLLL